MIRRLEMNGKWQEELTFHQTAPCVTQWKPLETRIQPRPPRIISESLNRINKIEHVSRRAKNLFKTPFSAQVLQPPASFPPKNEVHLETYCREGGSPFCLKMKTQGVQELTGLIKHGILNNFTSS